MYEILYFQVCWQHYVLVLQANVGGVVGGGDRCRGFHLDLLPSQTFSPFKWQLCLHLYSSLWRMPTRWCLRLNCYGECFLLASCAHCPPGIFCPGAILHWQCDIGNIQPWRSSEAAVHGSPLLPHWTSIAVQKAHYTTELPFCSVSLANGPTRGQNWTNWTIEPGRLLPLNPTSLQPKQPFREQIYWALVSSVLRPGDLPV